MITDIHPTFQDWNCSGAKILLRADLNVPLLNGTILDDRRLQAVRPTLDFLLAKKAMVILASHIGRPENHNPALSTHSLLAWFKVHNYQIIFIDSLEKAAKEPIKPGTILLLENLRFDTREKIADPAFARELRKLADWYVLDAFGAIHRTDSSLALLAQLYDPRHRSIGFLVEREITTLNSLLINPQRPNCFIIGGGKAADKIPLIEKLLAIADTIAICPALSFTFLKAMGKQVGISLVEDRLLDQARDIIAQAKQQSVNLLFPVDYQVALADANGPLSYVSADAIATNQLGVSIGPKTVQLISNTITQSKTVFYNGMMGFPEHSESLKGVEAIMTAMARSAATTIVAGGESLAIVDRLHLNITHCMTGGGATISYLAGQELPAIEPFLKDGAKSNKA